MTNGNRESGDPPARCQVLFADLCERLGRGWLTADDDVAFEITPTDRVGVPARGLLFFRVRDDLVAVRTRGGRAEYAVIQDDGTMIWRGAAPLSRPEDN